MNECPKCNNYKNIVLVEYAPGSPERYDGVSEYKCNDCGYRQGRWTGFELHDGEIEPRYGKIRILVKGYHYETKDATGPVRVEEKTNE